MKESKLEERLVRGVKRLGGRAYKFVSPGNVGVPDRMIVLPGGRIIFVELKTDQGALSPVQRYQIRQLQQLGATVWVVRGMQGVATTLGHLRMIVGEGDTG